MITVPELSFRSDNGASRAWALLRGCEPVKIEMLFASVHSGKRSDGVRFSMRQMQQRVGPVVAHLNAQLVAHKLVIVPGVPRNSYHLREIDR